MSQDQRARRRARKERAAWVALEAPAPPERPALTVRRVVEAAVAMADEAGLEALSIRRLAGELGVTPMAIYGHVANKEQLLDLMLDHVLGEIELDVAHDDPLEAARAVALSFNEVLQRHPGVAGVYSGSIRLGPNSLRLVDTVLAHLMAAGFPPDEAVVAYLTLHTYAMGHSQMRRILPAGDSSPSVFGALPPAEVPHVAAAAGHFAAFWPERFERGLDLVFAGLGAHLAARGVDRRRRARRPSSR